MPHDHQKKVAKFYWATPELVQLSIDTALAAKKDWEAVPINDKIQMFLKVADQMADQYRADLNATTMLGQAKTIIQAEIDSACELIDFFRFLSLKILSPPFSCSGSTASSPRSCTATSRSARTPPPLSTCSATAPSRASSPPSPRSTSPPSPATSPTPLVLWWVANIYRHY